MRMFKSGFLAVLIAAALLTGCTSAASNEGGLTVVPSEKENTVNTGEFGAVLPENETVAEEEILAEETSAEKETSVREETAAAEEPNNTRYYFKNKKTRDSHFEKHGAEFGGIYKTAEEYETGADRVAHDPNALHKLEKEDNDDVYYIEDTNEFVIVSPDGYIRTYFKPSAGKKYFDRQ